MKSFTLLPFLRTVKLPVVLLITTSNSKAYQVLVTGNAPGISRQHGSTENAGSQQDRAVRTKYHAALRRRPVEQGQIDAGARAADRRRLTKRNDEMMHGVVDAAAFDDGRRARPGGEIERLTAGKSTGRNKSNIGRVPLLLSQ